MQNMQPNPTLIKTLVTRILEVCRPKQVLLFGSAARGEMRANSDLDVLIVVPDGVHRRRTAQAVYRQLLGFGFAKDIMVATESDIRQYGSDPSLVFKQALEEGKELYHAA